MLAIKGLRLFAIAGASYCALATFAVQVVNVYPEPEIASRVQYYLLVIAAWSFSAMLWSIVLQHHLKH